MPTTTKALADPLARLTRARFLGHRRRTDLEELHALVPRLLADGLTEAEVARSTLLSRDTVRRLNGKPRA